MSVLDEGNALVRAAVEAAIAKGDEIGVQISAYHRNVKFVDVAAGIADQASGRPVTDDTLFNIWSVSKAITATALHLQAERGLIDYDAPIAAYWPEFAAQGKGGITVRHALTHRSGLPQMPADITPEKMVDWDWVTGAIADLEPMAAPGEKPMYQALSFGWIIGELIRRTDPKHRDVNSFLQQEINQPLGIDNLWLGLPADRVDRVAVLKDEMFSVPPEHLPPLWAAAAPHAVRLSPDIFDANAVRRAVIPGVGGIANAASVARFFGMLANGGELDGVRLLSRERVADFATPRSGSHETDPVYFDQVMSLSTSGFWLYAPGSITAALATPTAFGCPGVGGTLGWADMGEELAVSFCHNRMYMPAPGDVDPFIAIADAVREALALLKQAA